MMQKTQVDIMSKKFNALMAAGLFLLTSVLAAMVNSSAVVAAPTLNITSPAASQAIPGGPVTITGTSTPNTTVVIYNATKPIKTVISDSSGNWSTTINGLPNGNVTLTAKAISNGESLYFSAFDPGSNSASINQLRLTDNVLNTKPGYGLATTGQYLIPMGVYGFNTVFFTHLNDPTAAPGKFDINSPTEPVGVSGYAANPNVAGGTFNKDKTKGYFINSDLDNVSVVDIASNTQITTIPVGDQAQVAMLGGNGLIYVSNVVSSSITVIDPSTDTVAQTISVSCPSVNSVGATAFPEGENYFIVACAQDGILQYRNLADGSVIKSVNISASLSTVGSMQISPDNKKIYLSGVYGTASADNVAVFDVESETVQTVIDLTDQVFTAAVSPDGQYVYALTLGSFNTANIDVISTATNTIVDTIDTTSVGVPFIPFFAESSAVTASVNFRLGVAALANTGDSKFIVSAVAGSSLAVALLIAIFRRRLVSSR